MTEYFSSSAKQMFHRKAFTARNMASAEGTKQSLIECRPRSILLVHLRQLSISCSD